MITAVLVFAGLGTVFAAAPASAVAYSYNVGHPMFFGGPNNLSNYCTGGYAVRGSSGVFVTTAGHCSANGAVVYGTDERYGQIIRNDHAPFTPNGFDGALVRLDPDDTAYQIVVDPIGGGRPGDGRVRGWYANSALTSGFVIGKMGRTTGWTEGRVTGWQEVRYPDGTRDFLLCSTVQTRPGDSGGPVWRNDQNGVMAIGMVLAMRSDGTMCFNPIENILNRFGAWLPVFTSRSGPPSHARDAATVVTRPDGPPLPVNRTPVAAERV